ncbi:uncharacterized protein LOC129592041 [Paramacrobiotus metropolitanus]|uniref:uncharacterized protein LOC129592041 n=1 Tax=Paramacrobiotus metropolitanus TaxID=2943436 RepID=UPI002445C349|nr:uncharacterized protein LOC129592041 [Paramacrobiotus metropolitanus]
MFGGSVTQVLIDSDRYNYNYSCYDSPSPRPKRATKTQRVPVASRPAKECNKLPQLKNSSGYKELRHVATALIGIKFLIVPLTVTTTVLLPYEELSALHVCNYITAFFLLVVITKMWGITGMRTENQKVIARHLRCLTILTFFTLLLITAITMQLRSDTNGVFSQVTGDLQRVQSSALILPEGYAVAVQWLGSGLTGCYANVYLLLLFSLILTTTLWINTLTSLPAGAEMKNERTEDRSATTPTAARDAAGTPGQGRVVKTIRCWPFCFEIVVREYFE